MKKNDFFILALLLSLLIFFSCRSAKPSEATTTVSIQAEQNLIICEAAIKYRCSKVKFQKSLEERDMPMEITINPEEKLIQMNDVSSERKGKSFPIESMDCNLYTGLQDGYAIYRTLIKGASGEANEELWKLEAKDGDLTISVSSKGEEKFLIKVDSWELVKN